MYKLPQTTAADMSVDLAEQTCWRKSFHLLRDVLQLDFAGPYLNRLALAYVISTTQYA